MARQLRRGDRIPAAWAAESDSARHRRENLQRHFDGVSSEIVAQFDISLVGGPVGKNDAKPPRLKNELRPCAFCIPPDQQLTRPVIVTYAQTPPDHARTSAATSWTDTKGENR